MEHAQIGAYIMLLAKCWAHESCSLPQQPQILKTMINWRGTDEDFIPVLACFKPLTRGSQRLTNPRLYAEWLEAKQRTEMLSESGQKGAAKRWAAPAKPVTLNGSKSGNTWDAYLEAYQATGNEAFARVAVAADGLRRLHQVFDLRQIHIDKQKSQSMSFYALT